MNRLIECASYRIREELEEVLEPWPIRNFLQGTHSDLEVTIQGKHLPRPVPLAHSDENEVVRWKNFPLKANYLFEHQNFMDAEGCRKDEAIKDGMQFLENGIVFPPLNLFHDVMDSNEEPDDEWAMLESETETRYSFEGFLKRLRTHYAEYFKSEEKVVERPKYEVAPSRRSPKERTLYYDKRCEDKRKMIPFVYSAPPYPEYWLLKKKPKFSARERSGGGNDVQA